jgi:hypothetical protein
MFAMFPLSHEGHATAGKDRVLQRNPGAGLVRDGQVKPSVVN